MWEVKHLSFVWRDCEPDGYDEDMNVSLTRRLMKKYEGNTFITFKWRLMMDSEG